MCRHDLDGDDVDEDEDHHHDFLAQFHMSTPAKYVAIATTPFCLNVCNISEIITAQFIPHWFVLLAYYQS